MLAGAQFCVAYNLFFILFDRYYLSLLFQFFIKILSFTNYWGFFGIPLLKNTFIIDSHAFLYSYHRNFTNLPWHLPLKCNFLI